MYSSAPEETRFLQKEAMNLSFRFSPQNLFLKHRLKVTGFGHGRVNKLADMARLICLASSIIPTVFGPHQKMGPKICKDCRHFTQLKMSSDGYCQCFVERDLISGQVIAAVRASEARSKPSWCGEEALYFETRGFEEEPQPPAWGIELVNKKTIDGLKGTFNNPLCLIGWVVLIRVIFIVFFSESHAQIPLQ